MVKEKRYFDRERAIGELSVGLLKNEFNSTTAQIIPVRFYAGFVDRCLVNTQTQNHNQTTLKMGNHVRARK